MVIYLLRVVLEVLNYKSFHLQIQEISGDKISLLVLGGCYTSFCHSFNYSGQITRCGVSTTGTKNVLDCNRIYCIDFLFQYIKSLIIIPVSATLKFCSHAPFINNSDVVRPSLIRQTQWLNNYDVLSPSVIRQAL